jgi:hypothetical protein
MFKMDDLKDMQIKAFVRFSLYFAIFSIVLIVMLRLLCRFGFTAIIKEDGILEWLEFLWLLLSSLFIFFAARRTTRYSSLFAVLWLVPLIAGARELDAEFDRLFHGAWVIPAGFLALLVLNRISKCYSSLKAELLRFIQSQQMVFLSLGFFIVVVFAQVSGRQAVWHTLLGEHYVRDVGRFVEEYLEFLGYIIILVGSIECYVQA